MAANDRRWIGNALERVRAFALEVESKTSVIPLPRPATVEEEQLAFFDALITHKVLRVATRNLFRDGHYADAVAKAYLVVNNAVKKKAAVPMDGVPLMNHVFSATKPVLSITARKSQSQQDEHNGYRQIFAGAMLGIRNPHHHEHDLRDESDAALEMLVLANHLLRVSRRARR